MYTDVGTIQPMGHQQDVGEPVRRNVERTVLQGLDVTKTLAELQDHIEGLTLSIPDVRIEELLMRIQRHNICVPSH